LAIKNFVYRAFGHTWGVFDNLEYVLLEKVMDSIWATCGVLVHEQHLVFTLSIDWSKF